MRPSDAAWLFTLCCTACSAKSSHSGTDTVPQLLPTALPPCSWCHYSHTERHRSPRSLLRDADGRGKQKGKTEKRSQRGYEQLLLTQNRGKFTRMHSSSGSIFCLHDSFKLNIWGSICKAYMPGSLPAGQAKYSRQHMLNEEVCFTTGSLSLHRSLGAGRILPAALGKVTVWVTYGRAANIKGPPTL